MFDDDDNNDDDDESNDKNYDNFAIVSMFILAFSEA